MKKTKTLFAFGLLTALLLGGCSTANSTTKRTNADAVDGKIISMKLMNVPAQTPAVHLYKMFYWSAGCKVEALIAAPSAPGKYPLVLRLHGGLVAPTPKVKHMNFGVTLLDLENSTPTSAIVLCPEYRGYMESQGTCQGLEGIVLDVNNAIKAISSLSIVRPHDIYAVGTSMGGGAALMLASERSDVRAVAAISSFVGYDEEVKWVNKLKLNQVAGYSQELQLIQRDYGTDIKSFNYTLRSPIDHIETVQCPVLLLHGKADTIEPWQQIQDYANQMRAKHKTVKMVLYPDGVHGLGNHSYDVYNQISQWFRKYGLPDW